MTLNLVIVIEAFTNLQIEVSVQKLFRERKSQCIAKLWGSELMHIFVDPNFVLFSGTFFSENLRIRASTVKCST